MGARILANHFQELMVYAEEIGSHKISIPQRDFKKMVIDAYQSYTITSKEYDALMKRAKL